MEAWLAVRRQAMLPRLAWGRQAVRSRLALCPAQELRLNVGKRHDHGATRAGRQRPAALRRGPRARLQRRLLLLHWHAVVHGRPRGVLYLLHWNADGSLHHGRPPPGRRAYLAAPVASAPRRWGCSYGRQLVRPAISQEHEKAGCLVSSGAGLARRESTLCL